MSDRRMANMFRFFCIGGMILLGIDSFLDWEAISPISGPALSAVIMFCVDYVLSSLREIFWLGTGDQEATR